MIQKKFMFKLTVLVSFIASSLLFTACGDNPIEVENEKVFHFSNAKVHATLDSIVVQRQKVDLYRCLQANIGISDKQKRNERCTNFIEKYGDDTDLGIIIKMVSDTVNYSDDGKYARSEESGKPGSSSSSGESSSSEQFYYLTKTKTLNVTLTSYKQVADSIRATKKVGDPDIRYRVKTFIDGDESGYDPISALILDEKNIKEWSGNKTVSMQIPRGIDSLEICPIVIDKNELDDHFDNVVVLENKCVSASKIGFIENKKSSVQKTSNEKVKLEWKWYLFEAE